MQIKRLVLRNFRNYTSETVPFSPGVNFIYGKNGAGKTNLLEALSLLSTGRSFRTPHLKNLIRKGSSHFYIQADFEKEGLDQMVSVGFDGKNRKIRCNNKSFSHFSHLIGTLPTVIYTSADLQLIGGSPTQRRRFLNIQLAQGDPLYVYHLLRYHKAMKNRNALLKAKVEESMITYEKIMAQSASYLVQKRADLINQLSPVSQEFALELSDAREPFDLSYSPSIALKDLNNILSIYSEQREKELILGTTLNGPHRDDFLISYQGKEAKFYASEGQKSTCVAALKMAEQKNLSKKALLSIDDFGSHLDERRTHRLHRVVMRAAQVFLFASSTLTLEDFAHHHLLYVENGTVCNQQR